MTLEQVANIIGSKSNTISGWETGSRTVDVEDLAKLAEVYGVHPAALLFAPPGGKELEQLKMATDILSRMSEEEAGEWLSIGRRIARSED